MIPVCVNMLICPGMCDFDCRFSWLVSVIVAYSIGSATYNAMSIFMLDLKMFRAACFVGTDARVIRYAMKLFVVPVGLVALVIGLGSVFSGMFMSVTGIIGDHSGSSQQKCVVSSIICDYIWFEPHMRCRCILYN